MSCRRPVAGLVAQLTGARPQVRPSDPHQTFHGSLAHCRPASSASGSALTRRSTFSGVAPDPISPTRQMRPASGPRPAPISIPSFDNRQRRTAASFTPSGTVTALRFQRRSAGGGSRPRPSGARPSTRARARARAGPSAPPAPLLRLLQAPSRARRRAARKSCGDICASPRSPRAAPGQARSCGRRRGARARAAKRDGRQPGRRAESLLRAGIAHVDVPRVHVERHRAERRHGVGDHERAVRGRLARDVLQRIPHARGRFGMDDGHEVVRWRCRARLTHACRIDRASPLHIQRAQPSRRIAPASPPADRRSSR